MRGRILSRWFCAAFCLGFLISAPLQASQRLVAFSLSEAGRRLRENDESAREQLDQLGGITRLLAICPDKGSGDWIVVGEARPDCPPILIELVIDAFRVVGTTGTPWPVVSIDFTEKTPETHQLKVRFEGGTPDRPIEKSLFGRILLDMDVFLKKYSLELGQIETLDEAKSYRQLRIDKACEMQGFQDPVVRLITQDNLEDLKRNESRSQERHYVHEYRFWFERDQENKEFPGDEGYGIKELLLHVRKRKVDIPGSAESISAKSDDHDKNLAGNEAADEFARQMTLHFDKVSHEHPCLKNLKLLYDLTALSRFMANEMGKGVFPVSPNVQYLLTSHPLEAVETHEYLEVQDLCFRICERDDQGKASVFMICGGIRMKIEDAKQALFNGSANGFTELATLSRPKSGSLYWDLPSLGDWRHPNQAATRGQLAGKDASIRAAADNASPEIPGRDGFQRKSASSLPTKRESSGRPQPPESLFSGTGLRVEVFELGHSRNAGLLSSDREKFNASMVKPLGGVFVNPATWTDGCLLPGSVHKDIVEAIKAGRQDVMLDLGDDSFAKAFANRMFRLISLRELGKNGLTKQQRQLCGATRLHGFAFIKDLRGEDCVLITSIEGNGRPTLNVDDLAVALHNVIKGRRCPACTINPRADTYRRLNALRSTFASYHDNTRAYERKFRRIAREDQDVIVYGIRADNHFGNVMVVADYRMKSISNGTIEVDGLTSIWDMFGNSNESSKTMCNRFWFNPGSEPALFRADDYGTVMFLQAQVRLSTEEEIVTRFGSTQGKGTAHPIARKFADDFTKKYDLVALANPIYRELQNVFQCVAVADGMWKAGQLRGESGLIKRFLRKVQIKTADTPDTLPGIALVNVSNSGASTSMHTSVGGVKVAMKVNLDQNRKFAPKNVFLEYTRAVVKNRPSPKSVYWDVKINDLANR